MVSHLPFNVLLLSYLRLVHDKIAIWLYLPSALDYCLDKDRLAWVIFDWHSRNECRFARWSFDEFDVAQ